MREADREANEEKLNVTAGDELAPGRPSHATGQTFEPVFCPVCGAPEEAPSGPGWRRCSGCGAWFGRTSQRQGKVRGHAQPRAFSLPNPLERRELRRHAVEVMRGFFEIRKGRRAALNAFGLDVLELGCGPGFRLQTFEDYGWTAVGTEANPAAFEHARGRSLDVRHARPHEGGFGERRFDLVFSCGCFGRLPEPRATVEKVRSVLKPDGLVCVARLPVRADARTQTGEPLAPADDPPKGTAPVVHTPESLKRLFAGGAFSLVSEEAEGGLGAFWFRAAR